MRPASLNLCGRVALGTATLAIDACSRDRSADIRALRAGIDAGAGIVDTARAYSRVGDETSGERLVATAIAGRHQVQVITKGGHWRTGAQNWRVNNAPARLRRDAETSLRALGRSSLDIYLLHRADDPSLDLDAALSELVRIRDEGIATLVGLSNASAAQIEYASDKGVVDVVENPHGPAGRALAALALAEDRGIPYFAYSPLRTKPGQTLEQAYPCLAVVARSRTVSLPRLVLRGVLAESPVLSVVTGATRSASIVDSAAASTEPWDDISADAYAADIAAQVDH